MTAAGKRVFGGLRAFALAGTVCLLLAPRAAGEAVSAGPAVFVVDPSTSRVRIHLGRSGLLKLLGHEHEIEAPIAEGRVEVTEDDPARSTVSLRFEARRLAVVPGTEPADDIPKVEERMRGPEVLEVVRYPEIAFSSASVTGEALGAARYRLVIKGTLLLKGRPWPVELPLEVRRVGGGIEADGQVDLRLRDLGIEPPSVAGMVKVANRFRLAFAIRARLTP